MLLTSTHGEELMVDLEQICGDPDTSDCYVVLFKHNETHIGFIASRAANLVHLANLRRLGTAIGSCALAEELEAFSISYRKTGKRAKSSGVTEITFAVKNGNEAAISKFLEYARQCRVLPNPIVSDMRSFSLK